MRAFPWLPTEVERLEIVTGILGVLVPREELGFLVSDLADAPIAFFSDLLVEILAKASDDDVRRTAGSLATLIQPRSAVRAELERKLMASSFTVDEIRALALGIWRERAIAIQSYVGGREEK